MIIRPFTTLDQKALPSLLSIETTDLWRRQFFAFHGLDQTQTLVAVVDERMVGAISGLRSSIHPTGTACAIDVMPAYRRQRIGTRLVHASRESHPDAFPLRTKVATDEAERFIAAHGGRVYQVSRGETIVLGAESTRMWSCSILPPQQICITPASVVPADDLLDAFVDLYVWQHASWNPIGDRIALQRGLKGELADMDGSTGVVAMLGNRPVALALAFPTGRADLEVVAETVRASEPAGFDILQAAIAGVVNRAVASGFDHLMFDGHVSDPHLAPVLATIPDVQVTQPLLLMEIP